MGKPTGAWREYAYGVERQRTLKSRLFVLLRDELGMGRQPKVARLLVDEIVAVVESTLVDAAVLRPGQLLLLAPEVGQGPSYLHRTMAEKKMKAVVLDLVADEDVDRLVAGHKHNRVREGRMLRLVRQAFDQGATLTSCQLAIMTGVSPTQVNKQLRRHCEQTGEVLPLRGIVEDCSPAISHKAIIIARHLGGNSTAEIARATNHTPQSVERYIQRFEQVRELVRYSRQPPHPAAIARILCCSERLVRAYLELLPAEERPEGSPSGIEEQR